VPAFERGPHEYHQLPAAEAGAPGAGAGHA
jgi:hypothetical protein